MLNHVGTPSLCEIADVLVCLDYVARFIKHADDHPVRARAVLRIRDRAADCVGSCKPDWAVSQSIADQIKAVPIFAGTDLVFADHLISSSHDRDAWRPSRTAVCPKEFVYG